MHIRLIDANSLGYAHHHGQPAQYAPTGEPIQAITGLMEHVRQRIDRNPQLLNVWVWDGRAQWRYDLHPSYKSGRHRTPEQMLARQEYAWQQPWIKKALRQLPVLQVTHPNAEADDVGWGLSRQLAKQGHLVTLESADADWLQGVAGRVHWQNAHSPHQVVELANFAKASGGYLTPETVSHMKALTGDPSDDIEGVAGIAQKRAFGLLSKYKTVEGLIQATEDFAEFSREPAFVHVLMNPQVQALVRRNLALIDLARGPTLQGDDCLVEVGEWDELDFFELLIDLGLTHWQSQLASWRKLGAGPEPGPTQVVQRAVAALAQSWTAGDANR